MSQAPVRNVREIKTFEQSIAASQFLSLAVAEGTLDLFGPSAELEPIRMALNDENRVVGVQFRVRSVTDFRPEGAFEDNAFELEVISPGSDVAVLRPLEREWVADSKQRDQSFDATGAINPSAEKVANNIGNDRRSAAVTLLISRLI